MAAMTIEELEARQTEIRGRLAEIDKEHAGEAFPDDIRAEWNDLNDEVQANSDLIDELVRRATRLEELSRQPGAQERPPEPVRGVRGSVRGGSRELPADLGDIAAYRQMSRDPDDNRRLLVEGARRALESAVPVHEDVDADASKARIERLLAREADDDGSDGELARRILTTSSGAYQRAFMKTLMGRHLTSEEQRAMSLTTTAGGFAVPYTLDPTLFLTSSGVTNVLRRIARVITVTGNEWRGVSTAGVTASYSAEATETSDNSPTIAQPTANVEKAQAFIPFTIEIGQDWQGFQSEMSMLFADAKETLEATKFISGLGHASFEPEGLHVGATAVVTTAATTTFAVADLYSLDQALPDRFRSNASMLANRAFLNRVRQFDSSGGANLWVQIGQGIPPGLLGYPTYETSGFTSGTASGGTAITLGDFRYFLIVDRVGLDVELIPHLFATANNRPSGMRGLYAYWRNTSKVLHWNAFRSLKML